ncbi:MAG: hypothetical protein IME93_02205 [Proteobacteria bacterium]|nr:hypothetical protein [Pseudomonadota bacterium]
MPIFRWLIICLAVWLAVVILRRLIESRRQNTALKQSSPSSTYSATIACHHCSLHIPKDEALRKNGRYYCCNECSNEYRSE